MKFAIGDFVRLLNATNAEGKVTGQMFVHEEMNGRVTKHVQRYLVKLAGDPIWIDEDRLRLSRSTAGGQ